MENNQIPETNRKNGKSKRKAVVAILLVVVLLLAAGGVLAYRHFSTSAGFKRYQFDTEALEGRIQQMTEEEIQAELNRVVEEGMFNISIASAIVFESPTGEGEARIENVAANRYHMQVDIILDETGETVYTSKLIKPGFAVEKITLDKPLEPGEYHATAVFSAITQDELALFGQAAAEIRLCVLDEDGNMPTPTPSPSPAPSASPEAAN